MKKISVLIPALFVLLVIVQGVVILVDHVFSAQREIEERALYDMQISMNNLQGTLGFLVQGQFTIEAQELIGGLASDRDLVRAAIFDAELITIHSSSLVDKGKPLAEMFGDGLNAVSSREVIEKINEVKASAKGVAWLAEDGSAVAGIYPLSLGVKHGTLREEMSGYLFILRDLTVMKNEVLGVQLRHSLVVFIVVSALAFAVGLMLQLFLMRKINRLKRAAMAFARGESDAKTDLKGTDELSQLGQTFDAMVSVIARARRQEYEQQQWTQLLLDSTAEAIFGLDTNGVCTFMNKSCQRMLGVGEDADLNMALHTFLNYERASDHSREILNTCISGKPAHGVDVTAQRIDGTEFPIEYWTHPIIKDGHAIGAVVGFIDISERKVADKIKEEFVSVVSHELRTPLTSIIGSLGILKGGVAGNLSDTAQDMVDMAYANGKHLLSLINDILDMEKLSSSDFEFQLKLVDVEKLIEEAIAANMDYATQYKAKFKARFETDKKLFILGDYGRLMQVMNNLLSNASKYGREEDEILISVQVDGERVRIAVTDHGNGIPPSFLEKIFSRFSQADSSDSRHKGGTGLGLYITKKIIEKHNGTISFKTRAGAGTTFIVDIPRAQNAASGLCANI